MLRGMPERDTSTLNYSGRTWNEELAHFEQLIGGKGVKWDRIELFESPYDRELNRAEDDPVRMDDRRFAEILAASTGWVDLKAVEVDGRALIVKLVWNPGSEPGPPPRAHSVAVNYNGVWPWRYDRPTRRQRLASWITRLLRRGKP
jgi:hypothetical protein